MATSNGAWQNWGRIEWHATDPSINQGTTHVTRTVTAYFKQQDGSYQTFNGTKSWSGHWGSGSDGQAYNLNAGQRVQILRGAGSSVALTDSVQYKSFSITTNHWFGSTSSTWSIPYPARYAVKPADLTVTRLSESQHRLQWSRMSTYTAVVVQRRTDGGSWVQIARPTGNVYQYTDTTTQSNRKYEYRVAGVGGSGQSYWSDTVTVYTTPSAPTSVSATRLANDDIRVSASTPPYATSYDVYDDGSLVGSNVSLPWTHGTPNPAVPHTYTVRAKRGSLISGHSSPSNTVQLQAPPLAPTGLTPNGVDRAGDEDVRFSWVHSPVDSSEQTVYELRYRDDVTWTTVAGTTDEHHEVSLAVADYEWQVRTKGAHADWGPWSPVATVSVVDRPGVAVTFPDGDVEDPVLVVEWSWLQGQGRPQSAWRVSLESAGVVLEARSGAGPQTSVALQSRLVDGEQYVVTVEAATGDIWSAPAVATFGAVFDPPAPAVFDAVWSEETGQVTIDTQAGDPPVDVEPVTNLFPNPRLVGDGTWAEVRRNRFTDPLFSGGVASFSVNVTGTISPGELDVVVNENVTANIVIPRSSAVTWVPAAGEPYFASYEIENVGSVDIPLRIGMWNTVAYSYGETVIIAPGETKQITIFTPSYAGGGTYVQARITSPTAAPAGAHFKVRNPYVGSAAGPFFDGSTTPETAGDIVQPEDFRWRWLGAENASESVMEIERVAGLTASNCIAGVSSWEGKPAVRLIGTGSASNWARASFPVPTSARLSGVAVGTRHLPTPQSAPWKNTLRVDSPDNSTGADNEAFAELRTPYSGLTSTYTLLLGGGDASQDSGDVWWTDIGLFAGDYTGPFFHGDSGMIQVNDYWMNTVWDGPPDNSTSTAVRPPETVAVSVERSIDGGDTWETILEPSEPLQTLIDTQSLSNGSTLYRVMSFTVADAATTQIIPLETMSEALWLSAGDNFQYTARLPFNPSVTIEGGRERSLQWYSGREKPVAYAGEHVSRSVKVSGMLLDSETENIDVDALVRLLQDPNALFMFRDPDGRRIYGVVSSVSLPRQGATAHGGIWGYSFSLDEAEL